MNNIDSVLNRLSLNMKPVFSSDGSAKKETKISEAELMQIVSHIHSLESK